ncbi:MAG: hypothetical protein M3O88_07425, partial [Actinomycetota bacterium]|nr:hypothetical protein [Actinomycetota bacterium]
MATAAAALLVALVGTVSPTPASASLASIPDLGVWGMNGRVWAIIRVGETVYLGGDFTMAVGPAGQQVPRAHLAAVNTATGHLTPWNPRANGSVFALARRFRTIFVGGAFTRVKGVPRANFAAIRTDGTLSKLQVGPGALVRSLAVVGPILYLGGRFGTVQGVHRQHIAAVDLTTGRLTAFHPSVNHAVRVIQRLPDGRLLIGGVFTVVNGTPERYLALLGPGGKLGSWAEHPDPGRWVEDIAQQDGLIAVGEAGQGGRVQVFNTRGVERWRVFCNGDVQAIGFADNKVIAGGHFLTVDQLSYPRLVALTLRGKVVTSWHPTPDKPVWSIRGSATELYVAGEFLHVSLAGRTIPVHHFVQ